MKLPHRRHVLHLAAGAAALPAVSRSAWAQAYPSRPVRIIVSVIASVDEMLQRIPIIWQHSLHVCNNWRIPAA